MGNLGSSIGALLSSAAQGFLEAKEEDKIRQQQEKDKATLAKRETAKLLLQNPNLRREAQAPILAFLSGDKKAEKPFLEMLATGKLGAIPDITAGAAPVGPQAAVNAEGKLDAQSPTNVAIGAADRDAPISLGLPPAESFAPLEDFATLPARKDIFRSREEDIETALLVKEQEARVGQRIRAEERNRAEVEIFTRLQDSAQAVIEAEGIDPSSPAAKRLFAAAELAANTGSLTQFEKTVSMVSSPSLAQAELTSFLTTLPVENMSPDQVVQLVQDAAPVAFDSMAGADQYVRRFAQNLRQIRGRETSDRLFNRAIKQYQLWNEQAKLRLNQSKIALGGASLEDLIKLEAGLRKDGNATLKLIADLEVEIEKIGADFAKKDPQLQANLGFIVNGYKQQLADIQTRQQDVTRRIDTAQGKPEELDDTSAERPPTEAELVDAARKDHNVFKQLPMSNDAKRNFVVRQLAEKNEGQVLNILQAMASVPSPDNPIDSNDQISFDEIEELTRQINQVREKNQAKAFRSFF